MNESRLEYRHMISTISLERKRRSKTAARIKKLRTKLRSAWEFNTSLIGECDLYESQRLNPNLILKNGTVFVFVRIPGAWFCCEYGMANNRAYGKTALKAYREWMGKKAG